METYLVGGAVRDELLGIEVTERDYVVVGASEKDMLDAGFRPVGKDFPVYLHPETGEEYALARTERRTGRGHRAFECSTESVSLKEDLTRRDLTINAIARDSNGALIDPLGGLEDLERRQLRHISPAFAEDPLRILRVARFAARFSPLGFSIADETMALMKSMVAEGELNDLTPERVLLELDKAMTADAPAVFFEVIHRTGGTAVLWPELDPDAPGPLIRVTHLTPESHFRLIAALAASPVDDALAIARRFRFPNRTTELLKQHRLFAGTFADIGDETGIKAESVVDMLYQLDAFRQSERFLELVDLTAILSRADGADVGEAERQKHRWISVQSELAAISRDDVDPTLQGPAIGEAIRGERIRRLSA